MDNKTDYYLILADIKGSSALNSTRSASVMERLLPELARQNDRLSHDLVYPLEVNYGDEFAGLFSSPRGLYRLISDVRETLRPTATFRFVVAYGRIGYAGGTLPEMGGPVFERAAQALKALKTARKFSDWKLGDPANDAALTAMTNAANTMINDMTDYQYTVYWLEKAGLKGTEIAEKLGKNPRSISNAKKTGHSNDVISLERAVEALLDRTAANEEGGT